MTTERSDKAAEKAAIYIEKCPVCGLELAGPNAICACDNSLIPLMPAKDPLLDTTLAGYYRILEVVGRGGMGTVYKARDQLMDRIVAIKLLHQHLVSDPQSQARFQQEAKAASRINHPNVITAYDFGFTPDKDKRPFLVMDFLQGRTLSQCIEQDGPVFFERSVLIFTQVCDALAKAHQEGVIHRDLKPSNIMIGQAKDGSDFVKIVDFGIAKLLPTGGGGKEAQSLTQTGEVFGSPLYMSPEQFQGKALGVHTDIYALGCVMYESLMGKPPFAGDHVLETMFKHLNEKPLRFKMVRPDLRIPEKVETVVLRALEKDPKLRYHSMAEMRDDLLLTQKGFKDRRPFTVKAQQWWSKAKRAQRKYADLALHIAVGVMLVATMVGCYYAWMLNTKNGLDGQWKRLKSEGQDFYRKGDYPHAEEKFKEAVKVALDQYGEEDPRYNDTLRRVAWVFEAQGQWAKARKLYQKINKLSPDDVLKVKAAQMGYAGNSLSEALKQSAAREGAKVLNRRCLVALEKYLGPTDPGLVPLLTNLGKLHLESEEHAEAETALLRVLNIMQETQGQNSLGTADAYVALADLYERWKSYDTAKKHYKLAIETYQNVFGKGAAQIPDVEKKLAECEQKARDNPNSGGGLIPQ